MSQLKQSPPAITPGMIKAGVEALAANCPMDLAFPIGGEETAVEAVLHAALRAATLETENNARSAQGSGRDVPPR